MNDKERLEEQLNYFAELLENYAMDDEDAIDEVNTLIDDAWEYGVIAKELRYMDGRTKLLGVELVLNYSGPSIDLDTDRHVLLGSWSDEKCIMDVDKDACDMITELFEKDPCEE